ncbi:hypothetical protein LXL04_019145 [Taraxacum kok-saghyz]
MDAYESCCINCILLQWMSSASISISKLKPPSSSVLPSAAIFFGFAICCHLHLQLTFLYVFFRHQQGITRSLNGAPSRSPLWSAHEEQTHRSLGNPRTTGVKPGCIAPSWDRTPDLPKEANVDTHLIWKDVYHM